MEGQPEYPTDAELDELIRRTKAKIHAREAVERDRRAAEYRRAKKVEE